MGHDNFVKVGGLQKLLDALGKDISTHRENEGDLLHKLGGEVHWETEQTDWRANDFLYQSSQTLVATCQST